MPPSEILPVSNRVGWVGDVGVSRSASPGAMYGTTTSRSPRSELPCRPDDDEVSPPLSSETTLATHPESTILTPSSNVGWAEEEEATGGGIGGDGRVPDENRGLLSSWACWR
jgi:hypothetical protein